MKLFVKTVVTFPAFRCLVEAFLSTGCSFCVHGCSTGKRRLQLSQYRGCSSSPVAMVVARAPRSSRRFACRRLQQKGKRGGGRGKRGRRKKKEVGMRAGLQPLHPWATTSCSTRYNEEGEMGSGGGGRKKKQRKRKKERKTFGSTKRARASVSRA